MTANRLVILGVGGNCIDILDAVLAANQARSELQHEVVGFLDDDEKLHGSSIGGYPVLGSLADASGMDDVQFVNGTGSWSNYWKKESIIKKTGVPDDRFVTVIHPLAAVSNFASIETGAVLLAHVVVGANAVIGRHVMVLPLSVISHDTRIGDFSILAGGASLAGGVDVGESCYFGGNCSVRGNLTIGARALCGLGSVVIDDVESESVMVGNPAYRLCSLAEHAERHGKTV